MGDGTDRIAGFETGDIIEIAGVPGGFGDLVIEQQGSNAVLRYGHGDTITLENVTASSLGADDFRFLPVETVPPEAGGKDALAQGAPPDGNDDGDAPKDPAPSESTQTGGSDGVTLTGGKDADTLTGGDGDDTLWGRRGDDILHGEAGDDTLLGGAGDDLLTGRAGDDTLTGGKGADRLQGGAGDDTLTGGKGADIFEFWAGDGADTITDFGAGDRIHFDGVSGGFEALIIEQDDTDTLIRYGYGDTVRLSGVSAASLDEDDFTLHPGKPAPQGVTLNGGDGDDSLRGDDYWRTHPAGGDDTLNGGDGDDSLRGGWGDDTLNGGDGDDWLIGNEGADILNGGAGNDYLQGDGYSGVPRLNIWSASPKSENEDDVLDGGDGHDYLNGGGGDDTYTGGAGGDTFFHSHGHDTITDFGPGDRMHIYARMSISDGMTIEQDGEDAVISYTWTNTDRVDSVRLLGVSAESLDANDFIFPNGLLARNGGDGDDTLHGGGGGDTLSGEDGDDTLYGKDGDDYLYGGDGDDTLVGGKGRDTLMGGAGADRFVSTANPIRVTFATSRTGRTSW